MFFLLDQKTKKTPRIILGLLLFVFSGTITTTAQTTRITEKVEAKPKTSNLSTPKNPRKAVFLSAILPGAGQVYNEKSWKVPILYAGFMADIYFIGYNNKRYVTFRDALFAFDDGEANQFPTLNRNALVRNIEYWRQNRDMTILLLLGIYALNLVDATVDAHLSGFDISDDLALKFEPSFENLSSSTTMVGLSLKLQFK
ncbi:MAG: DUF5683 domain-containing protein [Algoriphagus aquaeductus]|uniref:DUF5683 domain-containing protein n=1 Tax=Algoriphagus aquaeductus TaxID=475299 RepID=UPI00391D5F22